LLPFAGAFLVLSGLAALTYQVVWVRLLGLAMGSTAASVATVLAAFFGGLAAGSALADRLVRGRPNFAAYLWLEAIIGTSSLLLVPILLRLDTWVAALPAVVSSIALKFLLTVALLSVPTIAMGATFPVMADLLARGRTDLGARLSFLYSLNTWGAVAGAGLAGFVLIPKLGLDGAVWVAVACNFSIVGLGLAARSRFAQPRSPHPTARRAPGRDGETAVDTPVSPYATLALAALVTTGFCSIAAEVGWTKYLAIFVGTTLYGFAVILMVFLSGIALGSWAVRPWLGQERRTVALLVWGLLAIGLAIGLTRPALSLAPAVLARTVGEGGSVVWIYAFLVAVLAPSTLLFGALFPASLELYCGGAANVRARAGRAYAFNTLAGIAGSVAAGFWLIPQFGTERLLLGLALVFPFTAAMVAFALTPTIRARMAQGAAALVAVVLVVLPALDYRPLVRAVTFRDPASMNDDPSTWRFEYLREAQAGVVSVITRDGTIGALQTNGLTESHLNFVDPTQSSATESLLGLAPYLLHPGPHAAFVVGFGGGNTAYALTRTRSLQTIRVVELEPAIVDAVRTVTRGFVPALLDPRLELTINDARNALLVDDARYDLIVSQPSHPWLAGSGTLFTREFFEIVRSRLEPGGVFGQWVNLFHMDAVTLGAILKSFYEVFPHGFTLRPGQGRDLLVFGSERPLRVDPARIEAELAHRELGQHLARLGIRSTVQLLADFVLSRDEIVEKVRTGPRNTDTNLVSEVRLARIGRRHDQGAEVDRFLRETRSFDLLPYLAPQDVAPVLTALAAELEARGRGDDALAVRARVATGAAGDSSLR
jgi:spermidine synthase